MSLKEIFSCYVSTTYRGDKEAFERIQQYFKDVGRDTENQWKKRNWLRKNQKKQTTIQ
mgnify:CR=1 FL=1